MAIGLGMVVLMSGCASGRYYQSGFIKRESILMFPYVITRTEEGTRYSILDERIRTYSSRWSGNYYVQTLNGLIMAVNVPGTPWLLYPFQYQDIPNGTKRVFGYGSGEFDIRISYLWGFLSIGRHWNFLWLRGFWWGRNDPVFNNPPVGAFKEWSALTIKD